MWYDRHTWASKWCAIHTLSHVHLLPRVQLGLKCSEVYKQLHNTEMPGCVLPASLVFLGAIIVASQWTVSSVHDWLSTIAAACLPSSSDLETCRTTCQCRNTSRQHFFCHLTPWSQHNSLIFTIGKILYMCTLKHQNRNTSFIAVCKASQLFPCALADRTQAEVYYSTKAECESPLWTYNNITNTLLLWHCYRAIFLFTGACSWDFMCERCSVDKYVW